MLNLNSSLYSLIEETKTLQSFCEKDFVELKKQYPTLALSYSNYSQYLNGKESRIALYLPDAIYALVIGALQWNDSDSFTFVLQNYAGTFLSDGDAQNTSASEKFDSIVWQEIIQLIIVYGCIFGGYGITLLVLFAHFIPMFKCFKYSVALFSLLKQEEVKRLLEISQTFFSDHQATINYDRYKVEDFEEVYESVKTEDSDDEIVSRKANPLRQKPRGGHHFNEDELKKMVLNDSIRDSPKVQDEIYLPFVSSQKAQMKEINKGDSVHSRQPSGFKKIYTDKIKEPESPGIPEPKQVSKKKRLLHSKQIGSKQTIKKDILEGKEDAVKERFNQVYKQTTNYYLKILKILGYCGAILLPPLALILYLDIRTWIVYSKLSDFSDLNMNIRKEALYLQALTLESVYSSKRRTDSNGNDLVETFSKSLIDSIGQIESLQIDSFPNLFSSYFTTFYNYQEKNICGELKFVEQQDIECSFRLSDCLANTSYQQGFGRGEYSYISSMRQIAGDLRSTPSSKMVQISSSLMKSIGSFG